MSVKNNPNFDNQLKEEIKKGLDRAAIIFQNEVKQKLSENTSPSSAGKSPGVKTGALRRSIQIDRSQINKLRIRVGTNLVYAKIQEYGGIISAKKSKFLRFLVGGKFISKKTVNLPARPYFRPALKNVFNKMKKELSKFTK